LPTEELRLGIVLLGEAEPASWNRPARRVDFFDLKGAMDGLMGGFGATWRAVAAQESGYHPGRCAEIEIESAESPAERIGTFGQLHPGTAERFDLRGREIYVAELNLERLAGHLRDQPQIAAVPRFPALDRDLALLLERSVSHEAVQRTVREAGGELLVEVSLFDEYRGERVPPDRKSLAYTLRFRAPDRTLTDAEVDAAIERISEAVRERLGAVVRGAEAEAT
jgi:phenylalanyl-tRNA synthetase beta chain